MYISDNDRYSKMQYVRCGKSGLKLPRLALGLWHNFGGADVFENSRAVIRHAFDLGITHMDLANNYGPPPGSAEENFGRILKEDLMPYRDELIISTKAGYSMWPGPYGNGGSKKYLMASLDQSLKRMGLDYVDIFYSHRYDPDTPLYETMDALATAVRQGKALYVGISNYGPEQTREAVALLDSMGIKCLINQPKYSMLHRKPEEGLLQVIGELGLGCIVFSPLEQGLLTNKYLNGIPEGSRAAKPWGFLRPEHITENRLETIRRLNEIAARRGQTLAQMALAWVLRDDRVTTALVGASSPAQLDDSVKALENTNFTGQELAEIEEILKAEV